MSDVWCGDSPDWGVHSGNPCEHCGAEQSLTEFLLARIAEREAARLAAIADPSGKSTFGAFIRLDCQMSRTSVLMTPLLNRARAARHATHPDYRDEWRP